MFQGRISSHAREKYIERYVSILCRATFWKFRSQIWNPLHPSIHPPISSSAISLSTATTLKTIPRFSSSKVVRTRRAKQPPRNTQFCPFSPRRWAPGDSYDLPVFSSEETQAVSCVLISRLESYREQPGAKAHLSGNCPQRNNVHGDVKASR